MNHNEIHHPATPRLNLLVLRCRDIDTTRAFYEGLGIPFIPEQHGNGAPHYAAILSDGLVLELYPAKGEPDNTRLGFQFGGEHQRIVQDPDGRYVEIWE
ncbi:hypothetical protein [Thiothrix subterranea]|uniref:VOC domain-containing protein n=1 Tax=Thiothrix subterranea TaxID=2735563 RepID=A0AA51MLE9_9GAMM|nr:hypothetical protein [Thiothrix subterranea]MDQ5768756.1 hypothetical protein [Thiothrix subterranea]WML86562.1 hypothetical protein RCG00_20040 [Thiothrix subterranea]